MNYFVANFKANIDPDAAPAWLQHFSLTSPEGKLSLNSPEGKLSLNSADHEIIVCPSFLTLPYFRSMQKDGVKLGSQDVSRFENGAYTGEVTVTMLEDVVDYVLIGHSERKKYFGETLEDVVTKLALVSKSKLNVVLCLISADQLQGLVALPEWSAVETEKLILVYEPATAISGGKDLHPATKEDIETQVDAIKKIVNRPVLYGGSVSDENIADLLPANVSGVLVGQKSLDPQTFTKLIENFPARNEF